MMLRLRQSLRPVAPCALLVAFCVGAFWLGCAGSDDAAMPEEAGTTQEASAESLGSLLGAARQAREAGEREAALDAYARALALAPDQPAVLHRVASLEAQLGRFDAALDHLEQLADLGATVDVQSDEAFDALRGDDAGDTDHGAAFEAVAARLAKNAETVTDPAPAEVYHRFDDAGLWPEGIAWDPVSGDLFVGSLGRNKLVRVSGPGAAEDFGTSAEDGLQPLVGVWVDGPSRTLWAASGDLQSEKPSELVAYHVDQGVLIGRYPVPPAPEGVMYGLNDVVADADGRPWATDMFVGSLWTVADLPGVPPRPASVDGSQPLVPAQGLDGFDLTYLNGLVAGADGRSVYLAHLGGLARFVPADGPGALPAIDAVEAPPGGVLSMADGVCRHGDDLLLVQNQVTLGLRLVRLHMNAGGWRVESIELLPSGMPEGLIPYTCAVADEDSEGDGGAWLYVVAAADFQLMGGDEPPPAPAIVRVPLSEAAG